MVDDAREIARTFALRIRTQAVLLSVVPLVFLIALFAIATILQNKTNVTATWSQRSTNALNQSDRISRTLTAANRSVADYTTRKLPPSALGDYRTAVRELPLQANQLQQMVRDEPGQAKRAARLTAASNTILALISQYLAEWQAGRKLQAQALVAADRTRRISNEWQAAKNDFDQAERVITIGRFTSLQHDFAQLMAVLIALLDRRHPADVLPYRAVRAAHRAAVAQAGGQRGPAGLGGADRVDRRQRRDRRPRCGLPRDVAPDP